MTTFRHMLLMLFAAVVAALVMRMLEPDALPWRYAWGDHVERSAREKGMRTADLEAAREIVISFSHIVLDARKSADFASGHLPGAMSLPVLEFDQLFPSLAGLLTADQAILVYCSGEDCDESLKLGEILIGAGYTNITLFAGGMTAWQEAGLEVQR